MNKLMKMWTMNILAILGWFNFLVCLLVFFKIKELKLYLLSDPSAISAIHYCLIPSFLFSLVLLLVFATLVVFEFSLRKYFKWPFHFPVKINSMYKALFIMGLLFDFSFIVIYIYSVG